MHSIGIACGSSSGTASAIAANLAAVGVGTETDGSIVCPSAATALVGVKPTVGLVSRSGIIPIAHSQDTAGPMTRTVEDAAILLDALAAADPLGFGNHDAARAAGSTYRAALDRNALRGARIGVARASFFGYSDVTDRIAEAAIADMKAQGAVIVDPANIPNAGKYDASELEVLLYEFKADLNKYLGGLGPSARVRSLADVIAFNEANRSRELPYFGQELLVRAQKKGPLTEKAYRDALAKNHRLSRTEGIDAVMDKYRLDALVAPTGNPGVDDRSGQRRSLHRIEQHAGSGGGVSERDRPGRQRVRPAGRDFVHRASVEGRAGVEAGLRLRTGHKAPAAAHVPGDRAGCRAGSSAAANASADHRSLWRRRSDPAERARLEQDRDVDDPL